MKHSSQTLINLVTTIPTGLHVAVRAAALLCLGLILVASPAFAASDTWNGGSATTGNWSDTANWGGATVATGDSLFFGGTARLANTNDLSSFSFSGITYNTGAGAFTNNGNSFTLNGGITNSSASTETIYNSITLGNAAQTINMASGNLTINGDISGAGSSSALTVLGAKTLTLSGNNTFAGGLNENPGSVSYTLSLGSTNALGSGTLTFSSGSPTLNCFGSNPLIITNPMTCGRDLAFTGNSITFSGPVTHQNQKQFEVNSGITVTLNGGLSLTGSDRLLKSLPGTLVLNGVTTGAGATAAENGVNYTASATFYSLFNNSGGTLMLGNPSALGGGALVIEARSSVIMANTDLSGVNALANSIVLRADTGTSPTIGAIIAGANNLDFSGNLYVNNGAARTLIVSNTALTTLTGTVYLSDSGSYNGSLNLNVAGTSGGLVISGSVQDGSATSSLTKSGAGRLTLSGWNYYSGLTTVSGGQLWANAAGASQSSTFVVNTSGGLVFSNDTAFVLGGLSGTGNISLLNDLGSPVALTVGNNSASTVYSGGLSGAGATLTKSGIGSLTLSGTNNYTGLTTVSQGTLIISPNFVGHGDLTVNDGANLGASANTASTSAQIGTLQIGAGTLQFPSLPAPAKAPITVNTLSPVYAGSGLVSVSVAAALNVGTYNLIAYTNFSGSITDFAAPSLPAGTAGYLTNNTAATPKAIQLVVTSSALELWTGSTDTNWDFGTLNWKFNNVAATYFDNGPARFDDTATRTTVNLAASVQPFSITVTNDSKNFTFTSDSGNYIYGATTLSKSGTGSLTLLNLNNAFTGDVSVNGGTLALSASTLGGGNVTLSAGALVLSASSLGNSGSVTLNGGTMLLADGTSLTNDVTDNASLISSNGVQSITGSISGSGSLTQNGDGTLSLTMPNSYAGGTAIKSGTIDLVSATAGFGSGDVTLGDGSSTNSATLKFGAAGQILTNTLVVAAGGSGLYTIDGNTNTAANQTQINGYLVVSNTVALVGNVFINGAVSGSGTIIVNNTNNGGVNLLSRFANGANTWTGNLILTNNSSFKTVTGSMNSNNVVFVDAGSTFDTLAQPLTIAGLNDGAGGGGNVVPAFTTLTLAGSGSYSFSGNISHNNGILLKEGSGTQVLSGTNTYNGSTTISNGTLVVNGALGLGTVYVYGGTLAGTGTIRSAMVSGGTLSPAGNGVIGTLTITNSLSLQAGGTLAVDINKTTGTNDLITGLASVTYGGTLAVNNLSGTLTTSDSFKLFSAGTYSGAFASITPATPAVGLAWNTNTLTTDGTLRIATGMASNPTNITVAVNGGQIIVSWPADHTGWYLQVQTNSLATGLGTNWVTLTNTSSASSYTNAVDPANGSVFYRLKNQP